MSKKRTLTVLLRRSVNYLKPPGYEHYLTATELSKEVQKDVRWLKRLEKQGRIPQAVRVPHGQQQIRLYSPENVEEIRTILSTMKPGPKPKNG